MKLTNVNDIVVKAKNNYLDNLVLSESELNELTESIRKDGIKVPLLVAKKSKILVDGYNRMAIAKKLKLTEVPVEYIDIDEDQIQKEQIILQVGRRNLKDADRKALIGKLINLKRISVEDAPKMGVSKNNAKFAAKVDTIVTKSLNKLDPKDVQKIIKVAGTKKATEKAEEIAKTNKPAKEIVKQAVVEKKTKLTAQQLLEKPLRSIEEAFDEYPQYQKEIVSILKSFTENL
jgi:ParB-like chromosome segregation protein Spo0J